MHTRFENLNITRIIKLITTVSYEYEFHICFNIFHINSGVYLDIKQCNWATYTSRRKVQHHLWTGWLALIWSRGLRIDKPIVQTVSDLFPYLPEITVGIMRIWWVFYLGCVCVYVSYACPIVNCLCTVSWRGCVA